MEEIQKLNLADRFFPSLLAGKKTNTLRWQETAIKKGYLLFVSSKNPRWRSLVWVTEIRHARMNEFAPFYNMTPEELQISMQKHYPDIKIDTEVSLVEHLTPQQTIIEHGVPDAWQNKIILKEADLYI
jgi:hypothetical protein